MLSWLADPLSETRRSGVYIPRDEAFSEVKQVTFSAKTLRSVLHALVPSIGTAILDTNLGFPYFTAIDSLFNEGMKLPKQEGFRTVLPRLVKALAEGTEDVLLFETPEMINRDKFSWFRDEEFSRQTLAGVNPLSIQLVTVCYLAEETFELAWLPCDPVGAAELIVSKIFRHYLSA